MKHSSYLILVIISMLFTSCIVQEKKNAESDLLNANHFLLDGPQTKVMLLGSWHFAYPNFDSVKTEEEDMIDLSTPKRQKEIHDVVSHLRKFKPTIICIESQNQSNIDSLYNAYLNNKHKLSIAEEEQLGFRLGKQLGLKRIHATDNYSWLRDEYDDVPKLSTLWDDEYYLDTLEMNNWWEKYLKYYNYGDKILLNHTVNECLEYENNPENLKASFGNYLVQLKTSNHNGPDALSLKWYNRNVRIFNKILKTNPKPEDRILVIFGSSHIAILEQLFDASPQFKIQRPYEY